MNINLSLDPSHDEYARTLEVVVVITGNLSVDIHENNRLTEPSIADLLTLAHWLLAYVSPRLAEGKLPVSVGNVVMALPRPPQATVRRGHDDRPITTTITAECRRPALAQPSTNS